MEVAFFKRHQRGDIFTYYKVFGGEGKTVNGYQEVINFLNNEPMIYVEHNYPFDRDHPERSFELTGTWCTYEVGIPITEEEYVTAYKRASSHGNFRVL